MKIYGACACNIDWQLPKQLVVTRDGHPIFERTNIIWRKKFVHEKWYPSEKTNDGRTTWIVHRDEKIIVVLKTNQKKQKKDFIDQTLFMNKCFYWTNDFTKQSVSVKTSKINGEWKIIYRTYFINILKKANKIGCSWAMNK